ncbi:leucine--tRNA ligase [Moheibacter sediminis]|uniref:Leucine--tRNA ligase n=1 Tax=Moheibacter sediminis TaxID=1434700 RepID=A0A1W2BFX9_9FLAO|nr:class I tRNA ligase family protein [Moheibacter sediminis]SMC71328.1 leucyl-tRNA synthetase [Moheibacter sediminis]
MHYLHGEIESKWQKYWQQNQTFKAENNSSKPKYYVLDMFPYPSGAGLHVGHPLGYIASDIFSRYKRLKGFNVLHPMGYDSFGLPAEQYAIQTGQHPAVTTKVNIEGGVDKQGNEIAGYRKQLDRIGFSFDWSREVRTSEPDYYKWTQWIFIQLFNSYYDNDLGKAVSINELIKKFEKEGNLKVNAVCDDDTVHFAAETWNKLSEKQQQEILLKYRLTYLAEAEVNWCPALGTVLANDEVVNGVSERGGNPVIRKKMTQWMMRITAYAERLLNDLDKIDWPQPIKDAQTYWIGKSKGASIKFGVKDHALEIEVFTTRPDTVFGVSYVTLAPEHPFVPKIVTQDRKESVFNYIEQTSKRSERERMADVTKITGEFTGAYAVHPLTGKEIPIWIGDYVLSSYGTGAVMAVPAGDERDYKFAKHFNLPIPNIFKGKDISEAAFIEKEGFELENSEVLDGLNYKDATEKIISILEQNHFGKGKVNYRLRDAVFSRQRYWGEPVPAYYKDGVPYMIETEHLPLVLPEVDEYLPTETGEPPLGRAKDWAWDSVNKKVVSIDMLRQAQHDPSTEALREARNENLPDEPHAYVEGQTIFPLELNTMPGWAGSSWYFMRYMDANNENEFASKEAMDYWKEVDLYMGGSEHATGHLLYARFWQKFLFDQGMVPTDEFAKKLINQGMILGMSAFVNRITVDYKIAVYDNSLEEKYRNHPTLEITSMPTSIYISKNIEANIENYNDVLLQKATNDFKKNIIEKSSYDSEFLRYEFESLGANVQNIHVDVSLLKDGGDELDIEKFKAWREEYADAEFILEDGKYICGREVEKMSKSKYNVINPDDICEQYGADTLRLYEMFLGPIEQAKPWNTQGLSGVYSFLKKFWRLYHSGEGENAFVISDEAPTKEEMKVLHQTIKKVDEDVHNFSFNTSVSNFMIAVNELTKLNCKKRAVLEPLAVLISPYAPHIAEELWQKLGHDKSISFAEFPEFNAKWLVEDAKEYPVSFNGKMRFKLELPMDLTKEQIQEAVMTDERTIKQLEGKTPKNIIIVPGKIINIVG